MWRVTAAVPSILMPVREFVTSKGGIGDRDAGLQFVVSNKRLRLTARCRTNYARKRLYRMLASIVRGLVVKSRHQVVFA
jgi:hypothetical protein